MRAGPAPGSCPPQRALHSVDEIDTVVGLFGENPPTGFGFSDTAFRVFILMASDPAALPGAGGTAAARGERHREVSGGAAVRRSFLSRRAVS